MAVGLSEAIAALIGAGATGIFGLLDRRSERKQKRSTLAAEVAAHAKFLTMLIREQDYLRQAELVTRQSANPLWDGALLHVLPTRDYLQGLNSAVLRAGELEGEAAAKLIEFAHRAALFLDSTNPDERFLNHASIDERRSHAIGTHNNIEKLVWLGDEISQLK